MKKSGLIVKLGFQSIRFFSFYFLFSCETAAVRSVSLAFNRELLMIGMGLLTNNPVIPSKIVATAEFLARARTDSTSSRDKVASFPWQLTATAIVRNKMEPTLSWDGLCCGLSLSDNVQMVEGCNSSLEAIDADARHLVYVESEWNFERNCLI